MKKLKEKLESIHKKTYGAYKSLRGRYNFIDFDLAFDHIQSDPYAPSSKLSIYIPFENSFFNIDWLTNTTTRIALGDFILEIFLLNLTPQTIQILILKVVFFLLFLQLLKS